MDAFAENTPAAVPDLAAARVRIAELEAELQRLRTEPTSSTTPLAQMRLFDVEGLLVKQAMERARGNISRAARALGLSRAALYRRLTRHGVDTTHDAA